MSLYNMVCKSNPVGGLLLVAIGLHPNEVPRIRDVWTNEELDEVTVFTRTGGGNREEYAEQNDAMTRNEYYLRNNDWEMDATYAEWHFRLPVEATEALRKELATVPEPDRARALAVVSRNATDKFTAALEAIKS